MEAAGFPETSVNFYQTKRRHFVEDNISHGHSGGNVTSQIINLKLYGEAKFKVSPVAVMKAYGASRYIYSY
jgi:hypothetical protein